MPRLYPSSSSAQLDPVAFAHPGREFRGAPFWSWNARLDRERLLRQMGWLAEMGMGGWHIHARTGLATAYLGEEFLAHVRACVEEGRRLGGLRTWLYDEDRWPSGFAGGKVTQDGRFRARHLLITATDQAHAAIDGHVGGAHAAGGRSGHGRLLARWAIRLADDGCLAGYRRLVDDERPAIGEDERFAYLEVAQPSSWFNNQTYVDTLNPEAIRRFIAVTHDAYRAVVGDEFGDLVPAIFTDEPQVVHKARFPEPRARADAVLPWTGDFAASYQRRFGGDPLDSLPEVLWDLPDGAASPARWRYHEHAAERFAGAFADQVGAWCERHGIALTGHMMSEESLASQTAALGEAMRSYRSFQIPGIDILADAMELTTAKQAQSAKHQYGREGMLSELYGISSWDCTFAEYKRQGDWQAALGVTVRVHHLALMSLKGEAKRDYPASIGYQSPWFREFHLVEDHFARVNCALTRGRPGVRIAVVHPIESFWLAYGPAASSAGACGGMDHVFHELAEWLLYGTLDFDFLAESLLPSQCPEGSAPLRVGAMAYDAVVVPPLRTVRGSTLDRLEGFADAGGRLIFLGDAPGLVDCLPSQRAVELARRARRVPCDRAALDAALAPLRELAVSGADGRPATTVLGQVRIDGDERQVFVCNTSLLQPVPQARVRLRGAWSVRGLDTADGAIQELAATHADGWTEVVVDLPGSGHALLNYRPRTTRAAIAAPAPAWSATAALDGRYAVELAEPNVLLLDQAEWRIGDGAWQEREEILRLDNRARRALGLAENDRHMAQPWSDTAPAPDLGRVTLRFRIRCEAAVARPSLALEDRSSASISVDGIRVPSADAGWWVDEDIRLVRLPALAVGEHRIEVDQPYSRRSGLEWHYLLGDFGVRVEGRQAVVIAPVRSLAIGDWCHQGLPFYTGNLTYRIPVLGSGAPTRLAIPHLGGPLAAVAIDGADAGRIWRPPWRLELGALAAGRHALALTVFGSRHNAFGALHLHGEALPKRTRCYPPSWRTVGDRWSYEYQSHEAGLLAAPVIEMADPHLA